MLGLKCWYPYVLVIVITTDFNLAYQLNIRWVSVTWQNGYGNYFSSNMATRLTGVKQTAGQLTNMGLSADCLCPKSQIDISDLGQTQNRVSLYLS